MRRLALLALAFVLLAQPAAAFFFVVVDPWRLVYEQVTAELQERIGVTLSDTYTAIRRMGRRLEVFVSSDRYIPSGPPLWRTWDGGAQQPEALRFLGALNGTQPAPVPAPLAAGETEIPGAAFVDFETAVLAGAIEQTGAIRAGRRGERDALTALEGAVVSDGGATSRVEVLNAAELIAVRQRQARLDLATGIVSSLLPDALHARAVALGRLQFQEGMLTGPAVDVVAGSGDALLRWRMP